MLVEVLSYGYKEGSFRSADFIVINTRFILTVTQMSKERAYFHVDTDRIGYYYRDKQDYNKLLEVKNG